MVLLVAHLARNPFPTSEAVVLLYCCDVSAMEVQPAEERRTRVVFVSRRDTLRSRLASNCLRSINSRKFMVASCGAPPYKGLPMDPSARAALARAGITVHEAASNSWADFARGGMHPVDIVIVLDAAPKWLPEWPTGTEIAFWPLPDLLESIHPPATEAVLGQLHVLRRRLSIFASLPMRHPARRELIGDIRDLAYL